MITEKLIKEFLYLEAMGEQLRKRAYNARVELERFSAPAPSGVRKKKGLSNDQAISLVNNFRKKIISGNKNSRC